MYARFALCSFFAGLMLLASQAICREPPASRVDKPVRTDRYGDPLPEGAIARLGTVRLRHNGNITATAFSPDGKTLAVGDFYSAVRLWDVATGQEIANLGLLNPLLLHPIRAIGFSPDSRKLMIVEATGSVSQWEPATGKHVELWTAEADHGLVRFSSDGEMVALLVKNGMQVHLRKRANGKLVRAWKSNKHQFCMVSFSPDGKLLAVGSEDGKIHLMDVGTGAERHAFPWNHEHASFLFSPDGKALLWWSQYKETIHFCDPLTGKEVRTWRNPKSICSLDYSPDGTLLAVGETEETIRLLDAATGKERRSWKGGDRVLFSPDGKLLVATTGTRSLQIWETATGKPLRPEGGHTEAVHAVAFSPDGKLVASGNWPGGESIRLWDAPTGRLLRSMRDYSNGARSLAFSPDGETLASASENDSEVRLWHVSTGRPLRYLKGHESWLCAVAFSPDGKLLASGSYDNTARVWDRATGKEVRRFAAKEYVPSIAFAPHGKSLAIADGDVVHLWDIATGQELRRFHEEVEGNGVIAFSPDGQLLALGATLTKSVVLWETATGKLVHRIIGSEENGILTSVVFSPDGKTLAVADKRQYPSLEKERIQLWETAAGKSRGAFRAPPGGVSSLAFAPDGKTLAAGNEDTTILLWDMTGLAAKGARSGASPTPEQLERLWTELLVTDGARAFRAIWQLTSVQAPAVAMLSDHLHPISSANSPRVTRLFTDLDSEDFAAREKATSELERLGGDAEAALRKALADRPGLEVRRRIERLLEQLDPERSPTQLRALRAIEVLEHIGSPEAKRVLHTLAQGLPEAWLTREAKASLKRLSPQSAGKP